MKNSRTRRANNPPPWPLSRMYATITCRIAVALPCDALMDELLLRRNEKPKLLSLQ